MRNTDRVSSVAAGKHTLCIARRRQSHSSRSDCEDAGGHFEHELKPEANPSAEPETVVVLWTHRSAHENVANILHAPGFQGDGHVIEKDSASGRSYCGLGHIIYDISWCIEPVAFWFVLLYTGMRIMYLLSSMLIFRITCAVTCTRYFVMKRS